MLKHNHIKPVLLAVCLFGLLFASCGSRKVGYNPVEVAQLSREMGFFIDNTDENIPLYAEASLWLGVPYRYGGLNRKGIDCSGLVYRIYQNVYRKTVPRSTAGLEKETQKISKNDLRAGDLVFFATGSSKNKISHVGIFLKDDYFVHASSSKGVMVSRLSQTYYQRRWEKSGKIK